MSNKFNIDFNTVDLKQFIDDCLLIPDILENKYPLFVSENTKLKYDNSLATFQYMFGDDKGEEIYNSRVVFEFDTEYRFACLYTHLIFYVRNNSSDNGFVVRESKGAFGFSFSVTENYYSRSKKNRIPFILTAVTNIENELALRQHMIEVSKHRTDPDDVFNNSSWELVSVGSDTGTSNLQLVGDIWQPALIDDAKIVTLLIENGSFAANVANYYHEYFTHAPSSLDYDYTEDSLLNDYGIIKPEIHAFHNDNLFEQGGYKPLTCGVTGENFVVKLDVDSGVINLSQVDGKFGCTFMLTAMCGSPYNGETSDTNEAYVKVINVHGLKEFKRYFSIFKLSAPTPPAYSRRQSYIDLIWLQHRSDLRDRPTGYNPDKVDVQWFDDFIKRT